MVNKAVHPQEIELFYIIPALRREIAACMKSEGLSQKKIASLLHVTEPAVSQYFSAKRAKTVKFSKRVIDFIKECTPKIVDNHSLVEYTQKMMKLVRDEGVVCKLHRKLGYGNCSVNFCLSRPEVKNG